MTGTDPDPSGLDGSGGRTDASDPLDVFSRLAGPAAVLLEAYARAMSQVAGGLSGGQGGSASGSTQPAGLPAALVEASAIASGSSLRYAQRLTEVLSRHEAVLRRAAMARLAAEDASPERLRAEVEDFRRLLREVGETALLEARRLEHDLGRLGEALAQGIAPVAAEEDYQRRWAVKP